MEIVRNVGVLEREEREGGSERERHGGREAGSERVRESMHSKYVTTSRKQMHNMGIPKNTLFSQLKHSHRNTATHGCDSRIP